MRDSGEMARHREGLRYGPISVRSQPTQTLPVQTQPPTQLMSHEMHQYTQLLPHDVTEHVHGDTFVNDSDGEGSGDTAVLNDGGDRQAHAVVDCGPNSTGLTINPAGQELHSAAPQRDLPDSDATTEEGNVWDAGRDDADAESRLLHADAHPDDKGSNLPKEEKGVTNVTLPVALEDGPAEGTNDSKTSQSRPRSISSIRVSSLRASGLRAAGQSAPLNSAVKNGHKFDSESTVDLTHAKSDDELKKSQQAFEAESHVIQDCQKTTAAEFNMTQSSPKVFVPVDNSLACMSTSRSISKGVSSVDNVCSEPATKKHVDSDATLTAEIPNSAIRDVANPLAPSGPINLGLTRLQSQASMASNADGINVARCVDLNGQTGKSNSQKARKLVFDYTETQPTDKLTAGEVSTVSRRINKDHSGTLSKQASGNQTPARQGSLPGAASNNLSYLESHDPGEESQMNALNLVDKLVWLDASCVPDDVVTSPEPQDGLVTCNAGSKGLQSLAQAAQMKAVHDKLDVFDWEDTQRGEDSLCSKKPLPGNVGDHKRQAEASKLAIPSKKQALSYQQTTAAITPVLPKPDQKNSLDTKTPQVPDLEILPSSRIQDAEIKPHTVLTTRLRNRTKADSMLESKVCQMPGSRKRQGNRGCTVKKKNETNKHFETRQQSIEENIDVKLQEFSPQSQRRGGRGKSVDKLGRNLVLSRENAKVDRGQTPHIEPSRDIKVKEQAIKERRQDLGKLCKDDCNLQSSPFLADRTSEDDAAADIWIEAFSNEKNKRSSDQNVDLIKFKKRGALHDDSGQDFKKLRTMEPSPDVINNRQLPISGQAEITTENNSVISGSKSQRVSKRPSNNAVSSAHEVRSVKTRQNKLSQHKLDIVHSSEKELVDEDDVVRQASKKLKVSDAHQLNDSYGEHSDAPKKEWNVRKKVKAKKVGFSEQVAKHNETGDLIKESKKAGSDGFELACASIAEDKGVESAKLSGRPKTRSRGQETKSRNGDMQKEASQIGKSLLSGKTVEADLGKISKIGPSECHKKDILIPGEHGTIAMNVEDEPFKGRSLRGRGVSDFSVHKLTVAGEGMHAKGLKESKRGKDSSDVTICETEKAGDEVSAQGLTRSKRGKHAAGTIAPGSQNDRDGGKPQADVRINKDLWDTGVLNRRDDDVSGSLRKTRSSANNHGFGKHESGNTATEANFGGDLTGEGGTWKDAEVKTVTGARKSSSQQKKRKNALRVQEKHSISSGADEGRRKKRDSSEIRVLFSHSLTADAIKHQKKILAKLGGHLAMSACECTHFISNGFVRSQNMLVSMAAGKIVATTLWLESCSQARYFVDEKNYILNDEKKEKELGFSMVASLLAARRKPLFKDMKVLICPNTVPEPAALKTIVESAGGQVTDAKTCFQQSDVEIDKPIIIANEKDIDSYRQFLVKGLQVYSEELVLHGVVTQNLDFTRKHLFENFKQQRGSRRA